jgi:formylglycine-generating enzyme required for sulfatase activity
MVLLCVPAGEFSMGSDPARDSSADVNETPQHTVYLDAFWMDLTEVTNAMYEKCVQAGVCVAPAKDSSFTNKNYYGASAFDNFPVMHIIRDQAQEYCRWRGGRLPTEAEWEKAARGTDGRIYPWGNNFAGDRLNYCDANCPRRKPDASYNDGYADVAPVGSFPSGASPYGLLDMAGNVFEFVLDWYGETYYASSPASNPMGPASGDVYVVRGGAWDSKAGIVRTAVRYWIQPQVSLDYVGFRCMMSSP